MTDRINGAAQTPICDFVRDYIQKKPLRLHMPGHKGTPFLGPEPLDITEIAGADELYRARGVIRESEENAARIFETSRTLYSTEGSSLCIRAMVYLALLSARKAGRTPLLLAGRNAHQAFLSACALMDAQVTWLYPSIESGLISCNITAEDLENALSALSEPPSAVYVTSPDYLGNMLDIAGLASICRRFGTLLMVDNAHGAYLRFLPQNSHPIAQGADLCCDSAHKTLPVLTGGAYLHIGKNAPDVCARQGEKALSLFASSSPSYLILQSLDLCNAYLSRGYREKLARLTAQVDEIKAALLERGYHLLGREKCKITIAPKAYGYTGDALYAILRKENIECEFSDPDGLTMMLTPEIDPQDLSRLTDIFLQIPQKDPIPALPPPVPRPERVLSIREAMLAPAVKMPADKAKGRVLADAQVNCPPCIPIVTSGERIDQNAVDCFHYYGIEACSVVEDGFC